MSGIKNIPPCSTRSPTPAIIEIAPAIAEPNITDGIIRNGSSAEIGITPSEINTSPLSPFNSLL